MEEMANPCSAAMHGRVDLFDYLRSGGDEREGATACGAPRAQSWKREARARPAGLVDLTGADVGVAEFHPRGRGVEGPEQRSEPRALARGAWVHQAMQRAPLAGPWNRTARERGRVLVAGSRGDSSVEGRDRGAAEAARQRKRPRGRTADPLRRRRGAQPTAAHSTART